MQSKLADAKKDVAAGKDQVAKTKGKNLQSVSVELLPTWLHTSLIKFL